MNTLIKRNNQYLMNKGIHSNSNETIKKIVSCLNKKGIIVISGIIGSNKSGIIKEMIFKTKMKDSFFYFNGELDLNNEIQSYKDLEKIFNNKKLIILENIDYIDQAEKFIHSEFKSGKKIILIGNGINISGVNEFEILPHFRNKDNSNNYYKLLAYKIISKDIYIKHKLKSFQILQHTIHILTQNTQLISVRQIHSILKKSGLKISQITLIEYINAIIESKLIKKIFRYDMKKNNFSTGKAKYLFTSTHLRSAIHILPLNSHIIDQNLVFQKLEGLGFSIYTGKNGTFNFSFMTQKKDYDSSKKIHTDSSNLIVHVSKQAEKNEVKKEAKKLLKIPGDFQKYLIIDSIKQIGIRPSTYLPLQIIEINDFLKHSF